MGTSPSSGRIKAVQTPEEASPNSESHFREVLHSPDETERLAKLAESDEELTREEVEFALKRVPLIVLADDEQMIRNALFRMIRRARVGLGAAIKLEGDMAECFDAIPQATEEGKLPMILCHNGEQAEEAAKIVIKRQIQEGILIFDHCMGSPFGLDIFKSIGGQMPPMITRILHSGTHHRKAKECIKEGILDHSLNKPCAQSEFLSGVAQTFLRKILGMPPKASSK